MPRSGGWPSAKLIGQPERSGRNKSEVFAVRLSAFVKCLLAANYNFIFKARLTR